MNEAGGFALLIAAPIFIGLLIYAIVQLITHIKNQSRQARKTRLTTR